MRWQGRKQSDNIEDRRGSGSGGGRFPGGRGGMGFGGLIVVLIGYFVFGVDLTGMVSGNSAPTAQVATQQSAGPVKQTGEEAQLRELSGVVLASTEEAWAGYFQKHGATYREPKMVLYRGATSTACGTGQSAMGPFYCPADEKVYLDLAFYDDMKNQLRAEGDFAFAYVIAHEVGHHVQNLLGINQKVSQAQRSGSKKQANQLSVALELQADCFAGVWGQHVQKQGLLEIGDVEKAMNAAAAVGDDRLQQQATGRGVPDSFPHGSSEQRMQWFNRGFQSGDPAQCNTFG